MENYMNLTENQKLIGISVAVAVGVGAFVAAGFPVVLVLMIGAFAGAVAFRDELETLVLGLKKKAKDKVKELKDVGEQEKAKSKNNDQE